MFSFAFLSASTGSTTMGRSVSIAVIITGDPFVGFASKGNWFDLCSSARECVETSGATGECLELLASTGDCLELLASKGDCVFFGRRFCKYSSALDLTEKSGTLPLYVEYLYFQVH